MLDEPRILRGAGARREAGDHDVEPLTAQPLANEPTLVGHVAVADLGTGKLSFGLALALRAAHPRASARHRDDDVSARHQLANHELADVPRRAHHQDPAR